MAPDIQRTTRARKRAALVLVGVFLSGVAAGAGVTTAWRTHTWKAAANRGFGTDGMMRMYARSLELTEPQRERLRPAFERHSRDFFALNRKALPEHRAINHALDAEILPVLTPTQVDKFLKMQTGREKFLRGWAGEGSAEPSQP